MYNLWFAVENSASLASLKKGIERSEVNPTWFPVTTRDDRPFANLPSVLSHAALRGGADALFYESQRQPLPPTGLTRRVPTLISLDSAPVLSKGSDKATPAGFVVWSEWAKRQIVKQFEIAPSRVLVAHSGVDLANWDGALGAFERARARKTGLPERVRLLFVGDDFAGQGGEVLLDLLRNHPRLAESCELHLVVSRNTFATYLTRTLRPRYMHVYTYQQPRHEPTEFYLNADIFVLPSQKAVSPSLIAKAMAAGLPIVTTQVEGLTELVQDGKNGLVVEPGNQMELAQALQALIEDPARRFALGEGARRVAEAEFDATVNTNKILTFLKHITTEARTNLAPTLNFSRLGVPVPQEIHPYIED